MRSMHPTTPTLLLPLIHCSLFLLITSQIFQCVNSFPTSNIIGKKSHCTLHRRRPLEESSSTCSKSSYEQPSYAYATTRTRLFATNNKQESNILQDLTRLFTTPNDKAQTEENVGPMTSEEKLKTFNIQANMKPKPFTIAPEVALDIISASFPAIFRLGCGAFGHDYKLSIERTDGVPNKTYNLASFQTWQIRESSDGTNFNNKQLPIVLHEFEGCPFCRKVREAASILSLDVTYMPCPQNGRRHRRDIQEKYADRKVTFPFMRDPNTGVEMFESDDIIRYLFTCYGSDGPNTEIPFMLRSGATTTLTAGLASLSRIGRGAKALPSTEPPLPLILWSYEGSPFCKIVREYLCELELPHTQISCPRGSSNRDKMFQMTGGRFQVPYLQDPNEGVELFESAAILEYLDKRYRVQPSPVDYI